MKRPLLTLFALLAVSTIAQAEEPNPLSFFPHQVGDTWVYQYNNDGGDQTTVIKDSIDENGNIYIWRHRFPFTMIDKGLYVHTDPFSLNRLDYKLDAKKKETWTVRPANIEKDLPRIEAYVDDIYETILFDRWTTVKKIDYYYLYNGDTSIESSSATYIYSKWLASGIGLIQGVGYLQNPEEEMPDLTYVLLGCVTNSDTLGVLTGISDEQLITQPIAQVSPNPCVNSTLISWSQPVSVKDMMLTICDYRGTEVLRQQVRDFPILLNTATLACGTYWCTLIAGRYTITVPLAVER